MNRPDCGNQRTGHPRCAQLIAKTWNCLSVDVANPTGDIGSLAIPRIHHRIAIGRETSWPEGKCRVAERNPGVIAAFACVDHGRHQIALMGTRARRRRTALKATRARFQQIMRRIRRMRDSPSASEFGCIYLALRHVGCRFGRVTRTEFLDAERRDDIRHTLPVMHDRNAPNSGAPAIGDDPGRAQAKQYRRKNGCPDDTTALGPCRGSRKLRTVSCASVQPHRAGGASAPCAIPGFRATSASNCSSVSIPPALCAKQAWVPGTPFVRRTNYRIVCDRE